MSLGGPQSTTAERVTTRQLESNGLLLVAAAGNEGDADNPIEYPAAYDAVMSVAAIDGSSNIASFSSHNSEVDIAAPGVDVLSTIPQSDSSYAEYSGTSMATPHVAGVAALLMSQFPSKRGSDIRTALQSSARDVGACGKDQLFGNGIIDAMAAATYLENGSSQPSSGLGTCINVDISVLTDEYGEETTYAVTTKNDAANIVYRGGPYLNGHRSNYTDNIQLPDGCYNLILMDSYGDG